MLDRLRERFNKARLLQALQEAVIAGALAFALSFTAWLQGLAALPDLGASEAALRASLLAGLTAAGKGLAFFFSGTVVVPSDPKVAPTTDPNAAIKPPDA
jgi:hypothetical protein